MRSSGTHTHTPTHQHEFIRGLAGAVQERVQRVPQVFGDLLPAAAIAAAAEERVGLVDEQEEAAARGRRPVK